MVIIKVFNNNAVIARDAENREIVLMGCGIAFKKKNGDEVDKQLIEKTFILKEKDASEKFKLLLEDIPIEHVSPYKMSLPSLLNTMRYIEKYGDNHIRIYDRTMVKKACPRHGAVAIGSNACHGCPEFLFNVVNDTTDTVVCDMDMSYGDRKKDKYEH